ncbi:MAG: thioesterase family protein [Gammaproteobacteria bacterium]
MKDTLIKGLSKTARVEVNQQRTIGFMGDDCRVYATPELVRDIENISRELILEHLHEDEDSVGIHIAIDHMAATPLGMWVDISVIIQNVDGRKVSLAVECRDALDMVARGEHQRFVVDRETTAQRIRTKSENAAS